MLELLKDQILKILRTYVKVSSNTNFSYVSFSKVELCQV